MNLTDALELHIGQHVVILNAFGDMHAAVVHGVPAHYRDKRLGSEVVTRHGAFPKVWARRRDSASSVPWPITDVFTDLDQARARQAELAAGRPVSQRT